MNFTFHNVILSTLYITFNLQKFHWYVLHLCSDYVSIYIVLIFLSLCSCLSNKKALKKKKKGERDHSCQGWDCVPKEAVPAGLNRVVEHSVAWLDECRATSGKLIEIPVQDLQETCYIWKAVRAMTWELQCLRPGTAQWCCWRLGPVRCGFRRGGTHQEPGPAAAAMQQEPSECAQGNPSAASLQCPLPSQPNTVPTGRRTTCQEPKCISLGTGREE